MVCTCSPTILNLPSPAQSTFPWRTLHCLSAPVAKHVSEKHIAGSPAGAQVDYFGAPLRAVYIIDPSGTIRSVTVNDEQVGRSIEEVIRVVEGFQHATPRCRKQAHPHSHPLFPRR